MIAELTSDRNELVQLVRRFIHERSPLSHTRQFLDSASFDSAIWQQLGKELGLQGLGIGEEHSGLGLGVVEIALVLCEFGRELYNGPFLSTVGLAVPTLMAAAPVELLDEVLPPIARGDLTAALAFAEQDGPWDASSAATAWQRAGDSALVRITGTKTYVIDGASADLIIVTAADETGALTFALVESSADGLTRRPLSVLDQTRNLAELNFSNTPGRLLGQPGSAGPALRRVLEQACILVAAEQLGAAERCLELAVDYAGTRMQFGRAIGSFQAIKHRCADLLLDVETARSAVLLALGAYESGDDLAEVASLARAHCSDVLTRAASAMLQIHGGIGFTWEHDAHLFLKRAKGSEVLFGTPNEHRELLSRAIGL